MYTNYSLRVELFRLHTSEKYKINIKPRLLFFFSKRLHMFIATMGPTAI